MRSRSLPNPSAHAALRHGRWSAPGCTYRVTTVTADRRRWLAHSLVAVAVARELGAPRLWHDSHVHAWVVMPDRMHLLLTLGSRESIWDAMARIKSATGRAARAVVASSSPFWADGFHDQALRRDENLADTARDMIARPVRAGLVDTLWAWPFWDSEWLPVPGLLERRGPPPVAGDHVARRGLPHRRSTLPSLVP